MMRRRWVPASCGVARRSASDVAWQMGPADLAWVGASGCEATRLGYGRCCVGQGSREIRRGFRDRLEAARRIKIWR